MIYLAKKKPTKQPQPVNTEEKNQEPDEETENVITPDACFDHDDKTYYIDIEIPGVKKEDIDLSIGPQSLCIEAPREDITYLGCFTLAHTVNENKAQAKYENGLLRVEIPLKAPIAGKRIQIE